MSSAGRISISSCFQHGLQNGYLSLNPHVKGGLFPLSRTSGSCGTYTIADECGAHVPVGNRRDSLITQTYIRAGMTHIRIAVTSGMLKN